MDIALIFSGNRLPRHSLPNQKQKASAVQRRQRQQIHNTEIHRNHDNHHDNVGNRRSEPFLETLARRLGLSFADCNQYLVDSTGGLKEEYTIEGMHIYGDGYAMVLKALLPLLRS